MKPADTPALERIGFGITRRQSGAVNLTDDELEFIIYALKEVENNDLRASYFKEARRLVKQLEEI